MWCQGMDSAKRTVVLTAEPFAQPHQSSSSKAKLVSCKQGILQLNHRSSQQWVRSSARKLGWNSELQELGAAEGGGSRGQLGRAGQRGSKRSVSLPDCQMLPTEGETESREAGHTGRRARACRRAELAKVQVHSQLEGENLRPLLVWPRCDHSVPWYTHLVPSCPPTGLRNHFRRQTRLQSKAERVELLPHVVQSAQQRSMLTGERATGADTTRPTRWSNWPENPILGPSTGGQTLTTALQELVPHRPRRS